MVSNSGDGAEAGEEGSEEQEGTAGEVPPPSEESEKPEAPEMPELLNPTREELERAFPNPPTAPYPTLPDARGFTAEQLAAGGSLPVSYGGQVLDALYFILLIEVWFLPQRRRLRRYISVLLSSTNCSVQR